MTVSIAEQKRHLRTRLRARRRALTVTQQEHAARALARRLSSAPELWRARHIALYWPNDGELDPRPLVERLWRRGKCCYLPVLHPRGGDRLWFVRWEPHTPLRANRFGIPEPDPRHEPRLPARWLNLVLLPLVGFDRHGGRLGMGGGFYDRTFAFRRGRSTSRRGPTLMGVAHTCQELPRVPGEHWDIPLEAVATERGIIR